MGIDNVVQATVVGGGYIGLECAAALQKNGLDVTIVFPEDRFMARLFTSEIAAFYEKFYEQKGIRIIKEDTVTGFEGEGGKVGRTRRLLAKTPTPHGYVSILNLCDIYIV